MCQFLEPDMSCSTMLIHFCHSLFVLNKKLELGGNVDYQHSAFSKKDWATFLPV